jgi:hypothetical protein
MVLARRKRPRAAGPNDDITGRDIAGAEITQENEMFLQIL